MIKTYQNEICDCIVTPSCREPGHYQVTSFDYKGPLMHRQCESWADVKQCLHDYMVKPVEPEDMIFIN